ncbi:MAG: hypothetical protein A2Y93_09760 [Chloroflexi bacterium RBG_13_68_17]|nr:MAG: hypothetical protein A2Y93_09760 [Chloroflexi bacterium RBG_13_68_17]
MLEPGSILHNRYRIESQLGKGGMGAVFLAFDQTLQIQVALKENLNLNPESERQFQREATLLASLRHPNLPRVTDHFILEGRQYLVMDYIEGEDLHTRCQRQLPSVPEVVIWADALCSALSYLHSRKPAIIHRDIKPANLKIQPDGTLVLVDFGIAKIADQSATTTGARGLTPGFSPPEQYGGSRTDARSDQYALAATLYALLTGRSPVDSIERMLKKQELIPPRQFNPAVSLPFENAILQALELDQDDRFPDVATFRAAMHGSVEATRMRAATTVRVPSKEARPRRRLAVPILLGLGALVVLGGGAGALALFGGAFGAPTPSPTVPFVALVPTTTSTATPTPETPAPTPTETPPSPTATSPAVVIGSGGRIAFVSDRAGRVFQIFTMNPDGSDVQQLTFGPGNKHYPDWSPDGRRLLFVAPGQGTGQDVWVMNADGSGVANLTQYEGDDSEPVWSPDRTRIAFTSARNGNPEQIFVADITCAEPPESCTMGRPHNFSAGYAVESWAAWSPDGGTVAVSASINGAPGRIFLRPAAGGEPTQFDRRDEIIGAEELEWTPNGQFLVYTWYQPTLNEIYIVPLNDPPGRIKLTNSAGNKEPSVSPDGQYIIFTSTRDQNPEIYLMTINGVNEINLTNSPSTRDMEPDWQPRPLP